MSNNDIDFEQFIKLLDGALASDDKNVRQALRKFLFVAAMVMGDDCEPGPFTKMMETIDGLQRRISTLENKQTFTTSDETWTQTTAIGAPYIAPSTTSGQITYTGGSTSNPLFTNITTTSGSSNATLTINPNTTTTTVMAGTGLTGTTSNWWITDDTPGTSIKEDIKKGLVKLANPA